VNINFKSPGPVASAFMKSTAFVRGLRGPVGSAKSSTCTVECLRMMLAQEPNADKLRKTRGVIVRNTNPMLTTTVMKTWKDWIPVNESGFGPIKMHPPPFEQLINFKMPDGTEVAAEVYFLALDREDDVKKLLSLELTWGWFNEAREAPKMIIDGITQRLRRYPRMAEGGPTRSGLIMDTNPPDEDHWWPIMAGDVAPPDDMSEDDIASLVKPSNWEFFSQPPGMIETKLHGRTEWVPNPEAENVNNLHPDYYPEQMQGKDQAYIRVYLGNRYGAINDGRPVQPNFSRNIHVAKCPLTPWPGVPFIVSCDFGLTPAAVLRQKLRGKYQTLAEVVISDGGATKLAAAVKRVMVERFPGFEIVRGWGDPAGDTRSQADEKTPFQVMRAAGIPCRPCESNDPEIRRAAGSRALTTMEGGAPLDIIDPSCRVLIAGLEGAWNYKRVKGTSGFHDEPQKNRYSHICEAWEYGLVGEGEHRLIVGKSAKGAATQHNVRSQQDPLERFRKVRTPNSNSAWSRNARVP
jgi:hypothetical protein